jgi:hypothetical protein
MDVDRYRWMVTTPGTSSRPHTFTTDQSMACLPQIRVPNDTLLEHPTGARPGREGHDGDISVPSLLFSFSTSY